MKMVSEGYTYIDGLGISRRVETQAEEEEELFAAGTLAFLFN